VVRENMIGVFDMTSDTLERVTDMKATPTLGIGPVWVTVFQSIP